MSRSRRAPPAMPAWFPPMSSAAWLLLWISTMYFHSKLVPLSLASALSLAMALPARQARAFCGFFVAGGDATLFNDATQVALMRDGTRTILSMQNNYRGPVADFALVVPVPIVLKESNVKTLPAAVFSKLDALSAPRLVEYWEQDPCYVPPPVPSNRFAGSGGSSGSAAADAGAAAPAPVVIEAKFAVAEYEVLVLSATEATALETWLVDNKYNIPPGAAPAFKQYIQQGMYFFVAKVNPAKVRFEKGQAILSPLRFHYETKDFALPIRLGLVNSGGQQDLIVHVLSRDGRYEAANVPNVTIPTNIEVTADVKKDFGTFYTKLFSETVTKNPGAVVTEYSWAASSCDPCPGPTLDAQDIATLGGDVLAGAAVAGPDGGAPRPPVFQPVLGPWAFTLTRLHARYGKDGLSDDYVFKKAPGILGGREVATTGGKIEHGATPSSYNNFQGRYIIRHRWAGAVACQNPTFNRWGGPPTGTPYSPPATAVGPNNGGTVNASSDSPLFSRTIASLVYDRIPELSVTPTSAPPKSTPGPVGTGGAGGMTGRPDAATGSGGSRHRDVDAQIVEHETMTPPATKKERGGFLGCTVAQTDRPITGAAAGLGMLLLTVLGLRRRRAR